MVTPAQVALQPSEAPIEGLRSRKKARVRLAIEDAALELFERQGFEATTVDEIAAKADVSTTTFFRYFPTKADTVLSQHGDQLPALHRAIVQQPLSESDLVAVRRAIAREWVTEVDAERTARRARILDESDVLQGASYHRGNRWLEVMTDALAQRRALERPDARCWLAARVALSVMASGVEGWIADGCSGPLADAIDARFDLMIELCRDWAAPPIDADQPSGEQHRVLTDEQ